MHDVKFSYNLVVYPAVYMYNERVLLGLRTSTDISETIWKLNERVLSQIMHRIYCVKFAKSAGQIDIHEFHDPDHDIYLKISHGFALPCNVH